MANLTRWDPFSDLSSWQDRFNQFFNQAISGPGRGSEQSLLAANFIPPVDIYEDDHTITIQAEIPGAREEDVDVRLENNVLTISGERKLEHEDTKQTSTGSSVNMAGSSVPLLCRARLIRKK